MNFFEERDDELINVQLLSDAEQTGCAMKNV